MISPLILILAQIEKDDPELFQDILKDLKEKEIEIFKEKNPIISNEEKLNDILKSTLVQKIKGE